MKLLRKANDKFVFHLGKKDRPMLCAVLDHYPVVPSAHHRLSRSASVSQNEVNQRLLDEALAEQRQENKRQLQALLADPVRFKETAHGWHLTLSSADIEWLLQVLNDIRVGSWIVLGAPEQELWNLPLNEKTTPHALAMEMAGYFEVRLLEALGAT
jgi:hypothetical protein